MANEWNEQAFLKEAKAYQLVYLYSERPLEISNSSIQLVDRKLTFRKEISSSIEIPSGITPHSGELSDKLLELAVESGAYSRFQRDKRLIEKEFEKLYELWIKKAWESKAILVAPNQQGMVTWSLEAKHASIGLIAVDRNFQGQGWGKKLMVAAEGFVAKLGATEIKVATQEYNVPACRLYKSLGYQQVDKAYVYHYWADS